MKGPRTPAAAESAAIAPGYVHRCCRCGCTRTGPFPAGWDHVTTPREKYAAHCERCLVAVGVCDAG